MNLCYNAVPEDYLPVVSNKSANDLILNNLGGGYYKPDKSRNLLSYHLFRCHTGAPDGFVVSCWQNSLDSFFHVKKCRFVKTDWMADIPAWKLCNLRKQNINQ